VCGKSRESRVPEADKVTGAEEHAKFGRRIDFTIARSRAGHEEYQIRERTFVAIEDPARRCMTRLTDGCDDKPRRVTSDVARCLRIALRQGAAEILDVDVTTTAEGLGFTDPATTQTIPCAVPPLEVEKKPVAIQVEMNYVVDRRYYDP